MSKTVDWSEPLLNLLDSTRRCESALMADEKDKAMAHASAAVRYSTELYEWILADLREPTRF